MNVLLNKLNDVLVRHKELSLSETVTFFTVLRMSLRAGLVDFFSDDLLHMIVFFHHEVLLSLL